MTSIALIGNPNSGKTTLFNLLTGTHQRVGNWPGVTVEKKTGRYQMGDDLAEIIDLPGTYSVAGAEASLDEQIARDFIASRKADVVVNVIDAASLSRGLYLTSGLAQHRTPTVVVLNMIDVASAQGVHIDAAKLAQALGCPVVATVASKGDGLEALNQALVHARPVEDFASGNEQERYAAIDVIVKQCQQSGEQEKTHWSERIDAVVLNRFAAFPIFLAVMYLMFLISINVGSAFIDFFDLAGAAIFVETPRLLLNMASLPDWLVTFVADGIGGGVQLVGTFIPVIGALFLVLSFLEDSGYMARVAFIVDRLLRSIGLPGKAFVPLIVGFGCNVPSVMATRTLDSQPDRILTTLMAPYMSCGARLTVYALFAAAFFPKNGQNVVFALYLSGIVVAVLSALAVKKSLMPVGQSSFVLELPAYHVPTLRNILTQSWQRLKGFVLRAGKAIVIVVIALNTLNSIGTDGTVGNQNTDRSVLSAIGMTITPLFAPMGIQKDNWPATVGIFTGIFAKEVVVGTLDALYAPQGITEDVRIAELLADAVASVPQNLGEIAGQLADPLGLDLGDLQNTAAQAESQEVQINTITAMQDLFASKVAGFAYLLFILLYMPCVATIGAIYKEIGGFWASFSVLWSTVLAYGCAVAAYQIGTFGENPLSSSIHLLVTVAVVGATFVGLVAWGRQSPGAQLIPVKLID